MSMSVKREGFKRSFQFGGYNGKDHRRNRRTDRARGKDLLRRLVKRESV